MVGQTVSHYRVLKELGHGGMGVVYEAEDERLRRKVALKFIGATEEADADAKGRFVSEAQAASSLDHPNICVVHEIDQAPDGRLFIAMAAYEGETLRDRLARGRLSIDEAVGLATQIASGLSAAHEVNIVHRDIKPGNVMVTSSGAVKILDFGVAKMLGVGTKTRTGVVVGTLGYMAPEQVRLVDVDPRADVWALGVVIYEMLTGRRPFEGATDAALLDALLHAEPRPVREIRPDVPPELAAILHRSLRKSPHERFPSASEMLRELEAFRRVQRDTPRARSGWATFRRPLVALPVVAATLVVAALAARFVMRERGERWARETAIPEIERLLLANEPLRAYDLALAADKYLAGDRAMEDVWRNVATTTTFQTDPGGADLYMAEYGGQAATWRHMGRTPLENVRVPRGEFRWRVTKEGFAPLELAVQTSALEPVVSLPALFTSDQREQRIPASAAALELTGSNPSRQFPLAEFTIDRYEVTNREFKAFVDAGGYQDRKYWNEPVTENGTAMSWEDAMARFRDSTGRPGPATWELGSYAPGTEDHPVGGLSWYEAAAYAAFRSKRLPTVYHWSRAARPNLMPEAILNASNFGGRGPRPVGSGLGQFGTYDMAGNVREWCWNAAGVDRWILGGSWDELSYTYSRPQALSPLDRSPQNGVRLATYAQTESRDQLMGPVETYRRDRRGDRPVSDEVFEVFRRQHALVSGPLGPREEARDESSEFWTRLRVSVEAGYGGERMGIVMFLPKGRTAPHPAVIYIPGAGPFLGNVSAVPNDPGYFDFIVRSGRALVVPVFKGSYERSDAVLRLTGEEFSRTYRQRMIEWRQDLGRAIDYLQTRSDIGARAVSYLGLSFGTSYPVPILALEDRLQAAVLIAAGFPLHDTPPETDPLNYLPRIKMPVLVLNGRADLYFPVETVVKPFFALLGTDPSRKRLTLLDGGHFSMPRAQVIRDTLGWLDQYGGKAPE